MYSIGVQNIIIHQGYLNSCPCSNCQKKEENEITVYCKAFILGPFFWKWVWFAWAKQAFVQCNSCKKHSAISELNGKLKEIAEETINEFPIWKKNILGITVAFLLAISTLNSAVHSLKDALTSDETLIIGHWNIEEKNPAVDLSNEEKTINFINFYEDDTYSLLCNNDEYVSGNWNYENKEKIITLKDSENNTSKIFIKDLSDENIILDTLIKQKKLLKKTTKNNIILKKDNSAFTVIFPYKSEFNQWRIKALKKETDLEIRKRVSNLLRFYEVTFTEAVNKEVGSISSEKGTPFIVASNGIAIRQNILWNETFYSEADAHKGYELLTKSIPNEINSKEENTFIMLRDLFKEYRENLK